MCDIFGDSNAGTYELSDILNHNPAWLQSKYLFVGPHTAAASGEEVLETLVRVYTSNPVTLGENKVCLLVFAMDWPASLNGLCIFWQKFARKAGYTRFVVIGLHVANSPKRPTYSPHYFAERSAPQLQTPATMLSQLHVLPAPDSSVYPILAKRSTRTENSDITSFYCRALPTATDYTGIPDTSVRLFIDALSKEVSECAFVSVKLTEPDAGIAQLIAVVKGFQDERPKLGGTPANKCILS